MEQPDVHGTDRAAAVASRSQVTAWLPVAVGVALTVAGLVTLALGQPGARELALFRWVNDWPRAAGIPVVAVMQLGSAVAPLAVGGVLLLVRRREAARNVLVGGYAAWSVVVLVLKPLFGRGRPADLFVDAIVRGSSELGLAFPSGHAATATAVVLGLTPAVPGPWRVVAWTAVALTALGRLYVGAHLPADVVGGVGVGLVVAGTYRLCRRTAIA